MLKISRGIVLMALMGCAGHGFGADLQTRKSVDKINEDKLLQANDSQSIKRDVPIRTLPGGSWRNSCDFNPVAGWRSDYVFGYSCSRKSRTFGSYWDNSTCPEMITCFSWKSLRMRCGETC